MPLPNTRCLRGAQPGLADPTQRERILRHPNAILLFANYDPGAVTGILPIGAVSRDNILPGRKRIVLENVPGTGAPTLWRHVPPARCAPGVQDEGQFPTFVNLCGQLVIFSQEQWDIYKLDPLYDCYVSATPGDIPVITRLTNARQPPVPQPQPDVAADHVQPTKGKGKAKETTPVRTPSFTEASQEDETPSVPVSWFMDPTSTGSTTPSSSASTARSSASVRNAASSSRAGASGSTPTHAGKSPVAQPLHASASSPNVRRNASTADSGLDTQSASSTSSAARPSPPGAHDHASATKLSSSAAPPAPSGPAPSSAAQPAAASSSRPAEMHAPAPNLSSSAAQPAAASSSRPAKMHAPAPNLSSSAAQPAAQPAAFTAASSSHNTMHTHTPNTSSSAAPSSRTQADRSANAFTVPSGTAPNMAPADATPEQPPSTPAAAAMKRRAYVDSEESAGEDSTEEGSKDDGFPNKRPHLNDYTSAPKRKMREFDVPNTPPDKRARTEPSTPATPATPNTPTWEERAARIQADLAKRRKMQQEEHAKQKLNSDRREWEELFAEANGMPSNVPPLLQAQAKLRAAREAAEALLTPEERQQRAAAMAATIERQRQLEAQRIAREALERHIIERRLRERERWSAHPWTEAHALERYRIVSEEFDKARFTTQDPAQSEFIPWPVLLPPAMVRFEDISWLGVETFFRCAATSMDVRAFEQLLDAARKRFHPDRLRARGVLNSLEDEEDRIQLERAATTVAQVTMAMWRVIKER